MGWVAWKFKIGQEEYRRKQVKRNEERRRKFAANKEIREKVNANLRNRTANETAEPRQKQLLNLKIN